VTSDVLEDHLAGSEFSSVGVNNGRGKMGPQGRAETPVTIKFGDIRQMLEVQVPWRRARI